MRTPAPIDLATLTTAAALALPAALPGSASAQQTRARPITKVGVFSNQVSTNKATAGARIQVRTHTTSPGSSHSTGTAAAKAPPAPQVVLPSLPSDSPLLKNPQPAGPGSLWYQPQAGEACIYIADGSPDCYTLTSPATSAAPPDVSGTAAQLADQLDLTLAAIEASPAPARDGLTGATTWFWLAQPPAAQQRSISLAGETVTVTADPSQVEWSFGDGATLTGGAGVPYQAGAAPGTAVTHVYQTRCLPGDQGHDPYLLPGCQPDGYHVLASTTWTISYTATGQVSQNGQLQPRSTQSQLTYPVNESRAFLTGGQP